MPTTAGASAATTPTGRGGDAGAGAAGGWRRRCGDGSRRRGGRLNGRGTDSTPGSAPIVTSVAPRRATAPGPRVVAPAVAVPSSHVPLVDPASAMSTCPGSTRSSACTADMAGSSTLSTDGAAWPST